MINKYFRKRNKGFTLIELLVVISIIGLLSSMAVYAFNVARVKARDVRRKVDLKQIQKALELYYDQKNYYPPSAVGNDTYCAKDPDQYDIAWSLTTETNLLTKMPADPLTPNGSCYDNCYLYLSDTYNPAGQAKGYALITLLESPTDADLATQKGHYPDRRDQCDLNRDWENNGYALYGGIWP